MSKYLSLWEWVAKNGKPALQLSFQEIQEIAGFPIDHSFLNCKKECSAFGYSVKKISIKEQTVTFIKN